MTSRLNTILLIIALLILGCAKAKEKGDGSQAGGNNSGKGSDPKNDRVHVYAILDKTPPTTNAAAGEKVLFNKVSSNFGECYSATDGFFKCKEGFYNISVTVNWTGDVTMPEATAICFANLNMDGAPFPLMYTTGAYNKGQPCSVHFAITLYLKEGMKFSVSAGTSSSRVTLTQVNYVYGVLSVTGEAI